jgi:hypothetical protein
VSKLKLAAFMGLLVVLLLWVREGLLRFAAEPIAIAYGFAAGLVESLPQLYVWAGIVAFFLVVGLRRVPLRIGSQVAHSVPSQSYRSSLGKWMMLIQDRSRGAYFHWRLANRLAELDQWIGRDSSNASDEVAAYLQLGSDSRTIGFENEMSALNVELDSIVDYLEKKANDD